MSDWQEETKRHARKAGETLTDSATDYFRWATDNPVDAAVSAACWFAAGALVAWVLL